MLIDSPELCSPAGLSSSTGSLKMYEVTNLLSSTLDGEKAQCKRQRGAEPATEQPIDNGWRSRGKKLYCCAATAAEITAITHTASTILTLSKDHTHTHTAE